LRFEDEPNFRHSLWEMDEGTLDHFVVSLWCASLFQGTLTALLPEMDLTDVYQLLFTDVEIRYAAYLADMSGFLV